MYATERLIPEKRPPYNKGTYLNINITFQNICFIHILKITKEKDRENWPYYTQHLLWAKGNKSYIDFRMHC